MGARHKMHPSLLWPSLPGSPPNSPSTPTPRPVQPAIGGERDWRTRAQMLNSCKLLARVSPTGAAAEPDQGSRNGGRRSPGRVERAHARGGPASQLHRHPANPGPGHTHTHTPQPTTPVSSERRPPSLPRFPNSCGSPRPHPPAALPGPLLHHFGPRRSEQAARGGRGREGRLLKCQSLPAVTGDPL